MANLCGARARSTGKTCTQPVNPPATRCRFHGGASPNAKAAVERRLAEQQAREAVATYGLPREIDPRDALLEEVYRTAGHVSWLADRIRELGAGDLIWGVTEEIDKGAGEFPGTDVKRSAVPHAWLDLYHRERRHLVDVSKAAIAAGIEERRVRLAEQQGNLLAAVIRGVLEDLGVAGDPRVPTVVGARIQSMLAAA